jgi:ring-1,2-phenylacetyl-CoA epoxidase subunit PaaA
MASVVPLCEEVGVDVPAHLDEASGEWVLEYELPCQFDPDAKRWLFDEPISWDQVWDRWRARGPMNERYTEMIQGRGNDLFSGNGKGSGPLRGRKPSA